MSSVTSGSWVKYSSHAVAAVIYAVKVYRLWCRGTWVDGSALILVCANLGGDD